MRERTEKAIERIYTYMYIHRLKYRGVREREGAGEVLGIKYC